MCLVETVPTFQYVVAEKMETLIFTRSHMEKKKTNGYKLLLGRLLLHTRGEFYTRRSISWNNLPKEVVDSPNLDAFKIQLDSLLKCLV